MVAWIGSSSGQVNSGQKAVRSQLCHFLAVRPWADYLTSLSLYVLVGQTKLMTRLTHVAGVILVVPT